MLKAMQRQSADVFFADTNDCFVSRSEKISVPPSTPPALRDFAETVDVEMVLIVDEASVTKDDYELLESKANIIIKEFGKATAGRFRR